MDGWIKLHRKIIGSAIFSDPDILRLWIYCLAKAAYKETTVIFEKQEISLLPGEFITGRFALYSEYNSGVAPRKKIKDTTLWNWLKKLEKYGNIDIKTTNKYSVVSIVKWSEYQETLTTEPQQIDNRLTTDSQQIDTNKKLKNLENLKKDKEITTTTATDDSEMTVMDAYEIAFGSLNMTGLISGYIHEIKQKGCDDSFIKELFLETGESSTKPNLKLLRAIGDSWIEKGVRSREQSKEAKQKRISANGSGGRSGNSSYSNQSRKPKIEISKEPDNLELPTNDEFQKMMEKAQKMKDARANRPA